MRAMRTCEMGDKDQSAQKADGNGGYMNTEGMSDEARRFWHRAARLRYFAGKSDV